MKKIIVILIVMAFTQTINAQNTFNIKDKNNAVYVRYGIEPTFVFAAGYMHSIRLDALKRNIAVFGEVSSPTNIFGFKNYEVKAGGIINVVKWKGLGISYNLNFSTGHVQTKNFGSQKYAFGNKLLIGFFKNKWHFAFTGEHEKIFANKITHEQYYRDYIFPEAKDGWYKGAGGNIQLGIETGTTIKERVDIRLEIKIPKSEKFNNYFGSPANINLITAYRL